MSDFFKNFVPRDYQSEIHQLLKSNYDSGIYRNLVRVFTGGGKTTGIAAFLPKIFPLLMNQGPLMFLSHRREILFHAAGKFQKIYTDKMIGIEMGEYALSGYEDMMFISVDSLGRLESKRMKKYKGLKPGIILCDEGHHVSEKGTWDRILNYFHAGSEYTGVDLDDRFHPLVLYLTATPNRADGKTLIKFVDNVDEGTTIDYGLDYGIDNGWLVRPDLYDMTVHSKSGKEMTDEERAAAVCKVKEEFCVGKKTLIFASSVAGSKIVAATLNRLKIGNTFVQLDHEDNVITAGHVDGTTEKDIRDNIVQSFADPNGLESMTNRLVFTEGYDNPEIRAAIDDGATRSDSLFEQKVGRVCRVLEGVLVPGMTRQERLDAIAKSDKPSAPYFALYDTSHLSLSPAINLVEQTEDGKDKIPTVKPTVDILVYEEEETEEMPPKSFEDLDDIQLLIQRRDIWTGTVYNKQLDAMTNLRWCIEPNDKTAALWIPKDPTHKTDTPVIWRIVPLGDRQFAYHVINVGGFSEKKGHPTKSSVEIIDGATNFQGLISFLDGKLKEWDPAQYAACKRNAYSAEKKAPAKIKKRLTALGVKYGDGLTDQTANILHDDARIKKSINHLIEKGKYAG